jgi:hypothetical protein
MFNSRSCILSILVSCRSHTDGHLVFQKPHNHRFPKLKKYVFASILMLFNRPYYFIHKTIIHFSLIFGILRRMPSHLLRATVLVTQKSKIFIQQCFCMLPEISLHHGRIVMFHRVSPLGPGRHDKTRKGLSDWSTCDLACEAATDHHSTRSSISVPLLITFDVSSQLSMVLYF